MGIEIAPNTGATIFFVFSTQISFDGVSVVNEATQNENVEDQAHARRKSPKWTID